MNVLGKILIPRITMTIHYILAELEEKEREEIFRLKRVKQKKMREIWQVEEVGGGEKTEIMDKSSATKVSQAVAKKTGGEKPAAEGDQMLVIKPPESGENVEDGKSIQEYEIMKTVDEAEESLQRSKREDMVALVDDMIKVAAERPDTDQMLSLKTPSALLMTPKTDDKIDKMKTDEIPGEVRQSLESGSDDTKALREGSYLEDSLASIPEEFESSALEEAYNMPEDTSSPSELPTESEEQSIVSKTNEESSPHESEMADMAPTETEELLEQGYRRSIDKEYRKSFDESSITSKESENMPRSSSSQKDEILTDVQEQTSLETSDVLSHREIEKTKSDALEKSGPMSDEYVIESKSSQTDRSPEIAKRKSSVKIKLPTDSEEDQPPKGISNSTLETIPIVEAETPGLGELSDEIIQVIEPSTGTVHFREILDENYVPTSTVDAQSPDISIQENILPNQSPDEKKSKDSLEKAESGKGDNQTLAVEGERRPTKIRIGNEGSVEGISDVEPYFNAEAVPKEVFEDIDLGTEYSKNEPSREDAVTASKEETNQDNIVVPSGSKSPNVEFAKDQLAYKSSVTDRSIEDMGERNDNNEIDVELDETDIDVSTSKKQQSSTDGTKNLDLDEGAKDNESDVDKKGAEKPDDTNRQS